jgi:septation ring formation regulator EzrA
MPGETILGGRRPSERQREFDAIVSEWDECYERMQVAEKQVKAIATLVSIYDNQDEPEGQVSARRALTAIGETIGQLRHTPIWRR